MRTTIQHITDNLLSSDLVRGEFDRILKEHGVGNFEEFLKDRIREFFDVDEQKANDFYKYCQSKIDKAVKG